MVWCFLRYFIPTPSGRKRFNVLAALDALTKEIVMVVNESTVTAETVCELLSKLAAHVSEGPVTVVLDNARYQKCALVHDYAAALNIELLYLPSFSPHLNLIERLWRFVRKQCLYSHYYATFAEFRFALESCLTTLHRERRLELETLLAWNFQSFRDVHSLSV
jgi:transposase